MRMAAIGGRRAGPALAAAALVLSLAGCYSVVYPNQREPGTPVLEEVYVEPTVLGEYELCAFANDAVRRIITELWSAPDDAALTRQTVASYTAYALRLRELAAKADTPQRRQRIEAAASEAERYAREVERRQTYNKVDIEPTVQASKDAFPGCDLER